MYRYKLERVRLNDGTEIEPGKLTVVVGPNNSGKSRLLRDVKDLCTSQRVSPVVVTEVSHTRPTNVAEFLEAYTIQPQLDLPNSRILLSSLGADMNTPHQATLYVGSIAEWRESFRSTIQNILDNWDGMKPTFTEYFGNYFITRLTTESRLLITKQSPSGARSGSEGGLLRAFFGEGKPAEEKLSTLVNDAFRLSVKLDYSALAYLNLRVGESFEGIPDDPREAGPLLAEYDMLDDQGDGIRSFVATVLALLVGRRPVLLLDEPEAFLHPPQALQLGATIADQASDDRQIIVATHSVDLLRGILNRTTDVGVVRLTRNGSRTQTTTLSAGDVQRVANDPLLSSTRILDGLFYKGVVVVEADSDSAFYQRVARIQRPGDEIHYAHAHNKQTLYKVVDPYEKMGVKVAAVTDFDILKRSDEFSRLLSAKTTDDITAIIAAQEQIRTSVEGTPLSEKLDALRSTLQDLVEKPIEAVADATEAETLAGIKRRIKRALDESDAWSHCKQEGRGALDDAGRVTFDQIDAFCRERGLFIVPVGELESWLVPFGLDRSNNKSVWIVQALQTLSELDLPSDSKLANFVEDIHGYLLS